MKRIVLLSAIISSLFSASSLLAQSSRDRTGRGSVALYGSNCHGTRCAG